MKLIVTGQRDDGSTGPLEERELEPVIASGFPGLENVPIWSASSVTDLPFTGTNTALDVFFPTPGAFRYFYLTIGPDDGTSTSGPSPEEVENFDRLFPGLLSHYEPDVPGMHTTDTIDFIAVVQGTIVLDLGAGGERTLTAGDTLVQHGARHRWRNDTDAPATLVVFMLGVGRTV